MSDSGCAQVTPIPTVRKDVRDGEMERDGVKQNDGIEIHEHAEPSRRFTMSLEKHVAQGSCGVARRRRVLGERAEVLVHPRISG